MQVVYQLRTLGVHVDDGIAEFQWVRGGVTDAADARYRGDIS